MGVTHIIKPLRHKIVHMNPPVEARHWKPLEQKMVECNLCHNNCKIPEGGRGVCFVRQNIDGKLYSLNYGKIVAIAVDPIEKKPLYHFHPGSRTLSIATVGCNFRCEYCQNWEISQAREIVGQEYTPEEIVEIAIEKDTQGISYTYTEPTIFYEFAYDTSVIAHEKGLYNVFVTNGYIQKQPLREIAPYLDAANVDLKAMSTEFYQKLCHVKSHKPVLETIKEMKRLGIHVEITNLLIPGWNTSDEMIRKLCEWVARLDPETPVHFSRYHPDYKLSVPPTPPEILKRAYEIAKKAGLKHVYVGNIDLGLNNTKCPECGATVIKREWFHATSLLDDGKCPQCGYQVLKPGTY